MLQDHDQGGGRTADKVTNFNYADDTQEDGCDVGSRCPFQAHIRKTNPRGDTMRFIPGGARATSPSSGTTASCAEASPSGSNHRPEPSPLGRSASSSPASRATSGTSSSSCNSTWSNSLHFIRQQTGLDPISGQGEQLIGGQRWPSKYGDDSAAKVQFDFSPYVKLLGGEYFFAPSVGFLSESVTGRSGRRRAIDPSAGPSESSPCREHSCSVSWF